MRAAREEVRLPGEGDLLLAATDAIIAAQTRCSRRIARAGLLRYGELLENFEQIRELLEAAYSCR